MSKSQFARFEILDKLEIDGYDITVVKEYYDYEGITVVFYLVGEYDNTRSLNCNVVWAYWNNFLYQSDTWYCGREFHRPVKDGPAIRWEYTDRYGTFTKPGQVFNVIEMFVEHNEDHNEEGKPSYTSTLFHHGEVDVEYKEYKVRGKFHRTDGPALEQKTFWWFQRSNPRKKFYINGVEIDNTNIATTMNREESISAS